MYDAPRSGSEPRTARSPLRLRRWLAGVFLPVFAVAAALFAYGATRSGPGDSPSSTVLAALAGICAALALATAVDLLVVARRLRAGRGRSA
ncbi:DUF6343 family protein [Streptomyces sp. NPDC018610]|uniref:DUF6343 family protein n=1 Tax=Streptomyces sp. NPDC018610 TaxID=3365049 RepID=UPI0037B8E1A2